MTDKEEPKDPFDGEYIGNIWGWKTSFIGLGLILFFVGFMVVRSYTTGNPIFPNDPPVEEVDGVVPDSTGEAGTRVESRE